MKTILIGINSKYIHPNVAIRLLKANCDYDVDIKEFNIKDTINDIYNYIIDNQYDVLGISTYIWNVELVKELLPLLRTHNITIILGGPEVSYNASYYLNNNSCDYVIKNEGEEAFNLLLHYLNKEINLNEIPNLYYK
jgi:anaerobic magnesium-protoporphyrin IX monomethyl ester cyclase